MREHLLELSEKERDRILLKTTAENLSALSWLALENPKLYTELERFGFEKLFMTRVEIFEDSRVKKDIRFSCRIGHYGHADIYDTHNFLEMFGKSIRKLTLLLTSPETSTTLNSFVKRTLFIGTKCLNRNKDFLEIVRLDHIIDEIQSYAAKYTLFSDIMYRRY